MPAASGGPGCHAGPALPAKAAYALQFGGWCAFMPYLSVILSAKGFTPGHIGALTAALPLCTLVAAPLWTAVMDVCGLQRPLFAAACALSGAGAVLVAAAPAGGAAAAAVLLYCAAQSTVGPVVDRCTLQLCAATSRDWGQQRLWGAVTWGALAPAAGAAYDAGGAAAAAMPWCYAAAMAGLAAVVTGAMPPAGAPASCASMRLLVAAACRPRFAWFLFSVACCATGLQLVLVFVFLYIEELGASRLLMGLSVTVSVLTEIPIFRVTGAALRRLGAHGLLCVALTCQASRFVGYSLLSNPWWVLALEPLHGVTFACFWVAAVTEVNAVAAERAPGTETAAQGLLSGVAFGLGPFVGTAAGGWVYEHLGAPALFRGYAAVLSVVLVICLAEEARRRRAAPAHVPLAGGGGRGVRRGSGEPAAALAFSPAIGAGSPAGAGRLNDDEHAPAPELARGGGLAPELPSASFVPTKSEHCSAV